MRRNTSSCTSREMEALRDQLVAPYTPHLRRFSGTEYPLCRTDSHILPAPHIISNLPSHTRTLQVSGRTPLELWCGSQRRCDTRRIRATQGMPKRKNFNRPTLSNTSTGTHLEGRSSVEFKGAVYTVWIFICICMSLRVFLFAKKMKFLTKGGIHCISQVFPSHFYFMREH